MAADNKKVYPTYYLLVCNVSVNSKDGFYIFRTDNAVGHLNRDMAALSGYIERRRRGAACREQGGRARFVPNGPPTQQSHPPPSAADAFFLSPVTHATKRQSDTFGGGRFWTVKQFV